MPLATTRENSDYESTTLRYGAQHALGAVDAEVGLGIDANHGGEPGFYPYVSSTSRQDEVDKDGVLTLRTHGRRATTTLQLGATQQQLTFSCNQTVDTASCFQPSPSLSLESRVGLDVRNAVDAGRQRLVFGIDLSRGTVDDQHRRRRAAGRAERNPAAAISNAALAQTAAYFEDVADLSRALRAYAGIRAERDGTLGGEVSPSLGFETSLTRTSSLKVNYATAFRAPNASELYYPGYGNPLLHPERARVGDITLTDSSVLGGASFGWFTNHTNDLIVPVLVKAYPRQYVYIYEPENIDHAAMQGFTFELKTRPYRGIAFRTKRHRSVRGAESQQRVAPAQRRRVYGESRPAKSPARRKASSAVRASRNDWWEIAARSTSRSRRSFSRWPTRISAHSPTCVSIAGWISSSAATISETNATPK